MNKNPNSRPDIQVLEDRVVRLKSQIEEFQNLRLYKVSKQRLARVSEELEDCVQILNQVVGDCSNIPIPPIVNCTEYMSESLSEFSIADDSDLNDTLTLETQGLKSKYSAKEIVGTYSRRLQNCADTVGCSSGIIQVNQFSQLLNAWYQTRFTPATGQRNPKFLFKADKICDWVDLLMIAAGNAIHQAMFPAFLSDMHAWIDTLNTSKDPTWALPYSVMQIRQSDSTCYTKEALVLEKILKPSLYDESLCSREQPLTRVR